MANRSKIEWTESTWTPIRARWFAPVNDGGGKERVGWHCEHVSEGCRNCYAESINRRLGTGLDFKPGNLHRADRVGYANGESKVFLDEKMLLQPLRWSRPRRIFVCSMTDLFASFVPDEIIDRVFAVMSLCPQHILQVLTKRSERMRAYLSDRNTPGRIARICVDLWIAKVVEPDNNWPVDAVGPVDLPDDLVMRFWPLPNVWLGVSAEDQATADARVPDLLATPASIRFVSAEPLLGGIDFAGWLGEPNDVACPGCDDDHSGGRKYCSRLDIPRDQQCPNKRAVFDYEEGALDEDGAPSAISARRIILDWIIGGGESGRSARPMHPDWVRSIRDQCAAAGVAFFFKQWGEWAPSDAVGIVGDGPITDSTRQRPGLDEPIRCR